MDYEKKYKEALERAKQFSEKPYLEDSKGIVEYIFPELRESEDEKKISELKTFIAQCNGFNKANRQKAFNLIDALRPKNRWKPSELQLDCLSDAIEKYNKEGHKAPILCELLEQLKKLKR